MGLTGGIATGKSTVSNMLVQRGMPLVDADVIAREVVRPGEPGWHGIIKRFGEELILPDRQLDRKRLGGIVFTDKQARLDLQAILHPLIRSRMREQMQRYEQDHPLVIVDVPLLFESNLQSMFDSTVLVYVDRETQLSRLIKRDRLTSEQAEARLNSQMPIDEKRVKADYIIDNRGTLEETERQVELLLEKWTDPHRKGQARNSIDDE